MEVLIEKKMIDIKIEPVGLTVDKPTSRRTSTSTPTELEPSEEFPILYGLLTAPKSFKPRNSDELQFLPLLKEGNLMGGLNEDENSEKEEDSKKMLVTSRVQLVQCRSRKNSKRESRRRSRSRSSESPEEEEEDVVEDDQEEIDHVSIYEEADSQNLDFCRSSTSSPQTVDSSSNMSGQDENNSPLFMNYLSGNLNGNLKSENSHDHNERQEDEEDDGDFSQSRVSSPGGGSTSGGDESNLDDNIPTSTTSGFRRKAFRLEHAIGNIVKRRRVQKRSSNSNNIHSNSDSSSNHAVPISMAPSSPTVSTTCVDPPSQPVAVQQQRGRSEILERILRSNTTTTNTRSTPSQSPSGRQPLNDQSRWGNNDDNNNNDNGSHHHHEPFAKLRDLLTMPEDQLVKRRRIEYGINEENKNEQEPPVSQRRREFSPPRNNILASLLQKGRAPYDPISSYNNPLQRNNAPTSQLVVTPPSIHKLSDSNNVRSNSGSGNNEERPYKCSLCDLRFKKLPLLNRHVKTHSHIKRYVCRFCSHAFKRSDNLLAHMRTSCKGIKEADTKFSTGGPQRVPTNNNNIRSGQIIPQLLSTPPAGPLSPMVSRSQLEEALLNLSEKRYVNTPASSPQVSTTTGSPPLKVIRRPVIQPGPDFQSKHSKLLEILSGSPVVANNNNRFRMDHLVDGEEEEEDMPLPLSLKVERRIEVESPPPTCSSSSPSPNQSHFLRSHLQQNLRRLYSNNELPLLEEEQEEIYEDEEGREVQLYDEEEENDNDQPLDLGRHHRHPQPPPEQQPSVRSRDHPEIVSILSRQPKNVMMLAPDLRKLVGLDTL